MIKACMSGIDPNTNASARGSRRSSLPQEEGTGLRGRGECGGDHAAADRPLRAAPGSRPCLALGPSILIEPQQEAQTSGCSSRYVVDTVLYATITILIAEACAVAGARDLDPSSGSGRSIWTSLGKGPWGSLQRRRGGNAVAASVTSQEVAAKKGGGKAAAKSEPPQLLKPEEAPKFFALRCGL